MKKVLITFIFIYPWIIAIAQLPINQAYQLIKEKSIHRGEADWQKVDAAFTEKLSAVKLAKDSINSLVHVFELMHDYHSQVIYNQNIYANYPDFPDSVFQKLRPLVVRAQQESGKIRTQLLDAEIIYIQVPGIQAQGEEVNEMAQALSDSICQYRQLHIKGCIIDLRMNMGGQLAVMLAGLQPLLGNGYLGGGVDLNHKETKRLELQAGNFQVNQKPMTSIRHLCNDSFGHLPVAVLIGPVTASSGSITAIAFRHRPNTVFIGEPTADGYSTGNDYFYVADNLLLNLSTEFSQDREGVIYKHSVHPDDLIEGKDEFINLDKDAKVRAAIQWLKKATTR